MSEQNATARASTTAVLLCTAALLTACSAAGERARAGSGSHSGAGGDDTSGAGASGSGSDTSTASGPSCPYPMGATGTNVGNVVNANLSWQGFADGSDQAGTIAITDYLDCDGTRGINAVLIDTSATWCEACQMEAHDFNVKMASWQAKGIRVLTLMIENAANQPATVQTAQQWKDEFNLSIAVAADPQASFVGFGSIGLPLELVLDPRTMQVVQREEGYSGEYYSLESLALKNQM